MTWAPIAGVQVVGITGKARHGKDELARAFVRQVPGAERFAFSDAVAVVARALRVMTTRDAAMLQRVGTRLRDLHPDTWLQCLYYAIADRAPEVAIVTGIRYPDEAAMIRAMGGRVLAVVRPDAPALTDRDPAHLVEQQIDALIADADTILAIGEHPDDETRALCFDRIAANLLTEWIA